MNCPVCGKPVPPSKGNKPRKYCSDKCTLKAASKAFWDRKRIIRENERIARRIRDRIKDESVMVEIRGDRIIETRGRCCISSRCGVISQGDTRTLAEIAKPCISECESVRKARERMRRKSKGGKSCKR